MFKSTFSAAGHGDKGAVSAVKSTVKVKAKPKPKVVVKSATKTAARPRKPKAPRASSAAVSPMDDPNALTQPLTPRSLDASVAAQTSLWAGPAEADIAGQRAVSQYQQGQIPVWFQEYQQAVANASARTSAAYAAAAGTQQQTIASSSALDAQARGQQNQKMLADAQARGASVNPSVMAEAAQAGAARRGTLESQRSLTAGLGATDVSYRAGREVVAAGQKVKAQMDEAQRGRSIDKSASDLAVRKGQFAITARQKLIDAEHTKQLENKAFGLNVAKAQADVNNSSAKLALDQAAARDKRALDAAKLTNDASRIQIAQQQADTSAARAAAYAKKQAQAPSKSAAQVGASKKATATARNDVRYAQEQIRALRTHKVPVKVLDPKTGKYAPKLDSSGNPVLQDAHLTPAQIRTALLNGDGPLRPVNGDAITAALALIDSGYLSPAQITALRRVYPGLSIAGAGLPTARTRRGRSAKGTAGGVAGVVVKASGG